MGTNTLTVSKAEVFDAMAKQAMAQGSLAEASKPEAEAVVIDKAGFARIGNLVKGFIEAEDKLFKGDSLLQTCAIGLAQHFGTSPSYEFWEATRTAWIATYLGKLPNANEESAQKAWERQVKRMTKESGLEKPKSPSKEASRKAIARAEEKKRLESMVDSQLLEMMAEYKAVDNFKEAEKLKAELVRRDKEKNKGAEDKFKMKREMLKKAVGKISDESLIDALWKLVPESIKSEVRSAK